ncbi:hypothetical protein [Bailinhaonella thermotolerans]|uniref:Uncharacterized protein n=1 Tax=Bailinhaonella thermotolerans TaxID=1070861 RepID=A0A3A4B0P6_9ACTN|nr:hypothetical protein [Bailinhaonella thermotolerans]RJL31597.1 hypothetical protein D5H75_17870 [Bailinhaonella thermotolerans]
MIKALHKMGIRSSMMYGLGLGSIALTVASWATSKRFEARGIERADHWGLFIGEWAPTFFAMGVALRIEEQADEERHAHESLGHARSPQMANVG